MSRNSKEMSQEFIDYQNFIINHPNYKGFPLEYNSDGSIRWVVSGKSESGKKRTEWLDNKRKELGIPATLGWKTKVCYEIHPLKSKPCQICGRTMSLDYVYLNQNLANNLNALVDSEYVYDTCSDIRDVINDLINNLVSRGYEILKKVFKIPETINTNIEDYTNYILAVGKSRKLLGPGAMGNPPDRLDGFHSYNRCCRSTSDKGRSKANLKRYGDDRRAYENWSDGNWKAANRLMKEFNKYGVSADHIGPISLGFCHRPRFQPMTIQEQSTKNNRMSLNDVKLLISDEENGQEVISWHSKYIWDNLKFIIKNDTDAKIASDYMRKNLHFVLSSLAYLHVNDCDDFLIKVILNKNLHYSFFDYSFEDFNPEDGSYKIMHEKPIYGKNQENNATRYIRIAFESLENYIDKQNRKIKNDYIFEGISSILKDTVSSIKHGDYDKGYKLLNLAFKKKADYFTFLYKQDLQYEIG